MRRALATFAVVVALAGGMSGCADDGAEVRDLDGTDSEDGSGSGSGMEVEETTEETTG